MKKTFSLATAFGLAAMAGTAALAEYPERPIEMIVAYSAGGGTDTAARTLAPFIERYLDGATITVVNRPGAGGEIGFTALAQSEADGYTIGFINSPNLMTIPISREARYSLEDMQAIADVVYDPNTFAVLPNSEFTTLDELVAFARENPGVVTYGTSGIGGDDHLAALTFSRMADIEMTHVPFSGAANVRAAVLGGHVTMAVMNISEVAAYVDDGSMTALGQMSEKRWDGASSVPTFAEEGYDVVMGSDRGIAAPAGIPDEALTALQDAIAQTMQDPEFLEAAAEQNLSLNYLDAEAFEAHLEKVNTTLEEIWAETPWVE